MKFVYPWFSQNHVTYEDVFFHLVILVLDSPVELISSNNTLLIFPMFVFQGLNNLHNAWETLLCGLLM